MGNAFSFLGDQQGKDSSTVVALKTPEIEKIVEKKEIAARKKKPKTKKKKKKNSAEDGGIEKEGHGHHEHGHKPEIRIMDNVFALLGDQEDKEASTIIEEKKKIAEMKKKIVEETKKAEAKEKKQKKSSVTDDEKSLDGIVVDQRCNDHEHNRHSGRQGNTGDEKATQEHKAVNHHGNKNQAIEELRERLLAKEKERKSEEAERKERWLAKEAERQERHKQWLAREAERQERHKQWLARDAERQERWLAREAARKEREERLLAREAERKEREERLLAREAERYKRLLAREAESEEKRLAREEERKKEMARRTLKEYEEQKAYEKQKVGKASLSDPETPLRESTLDDIYTKQKSKDEMVTKDSNIKKHGKVRKTMNIEEFLKLPTEREGQDSQDRSMGEDSVKNTNDKSSGYSRTRATDNKECALPDVENTVKVKARPAPDLSEASFPVLGKVTKPLNLI